MTIQCCDYLHIMFQLPSFANLFQTNVREAIKCELEIKFLLYGVNVSHILPLKDLFSLMPHNVHRKSHWHWFRIFYNVRWKHQFTPTPHALRIEIIYWIIVSIWILKDEAKMHSTGFLAFLHTAYCMHLNTDW